MNDDKIMVSVCMITYNHEPYIKQAIEGVLIQKTNFKYELIIGEDCSSDNTRSICQEFSRTALQIRLLPTVQNLGMIPNFMRTLQACSGKYIAVCEGDDYWTDPLKLQKQVDFLENHREYAGSAHQSMVLIDNKENRLFRLNVPNDIYVDDIVGGRLFHTASIVFRRSALELLNNAPAVLSGDRLLNFCIAFLGKIRFTDDCMCAYRIHGNGMSSNATVKQMLLDLNCITYLKNIYPAFPKYRYMSYVYATIGLCKNGPLYQRLYYILLSLFFSFSYFPNNLSMIFMRIVRLFPNLGMTWTR